MRTRRKTTVEEIVNHLSVAALSIVSDYLRYEPLRVITDHDWDLHSEFLERWDRGLGGGLRRDMYFRYLPMMDKQRVYYMQEDGIVFQLDSSIVVTPAVICIGAFTEPMCWGGCLRHHIFIEDSSCLESLVQKLPSRQYHHFHDFQQSIRAPPRPQQHQHPPNDEHQEEE
jgi:hypothetical protein